MKILVCRRRRYGGITTFLLTLLAKVSFREQDILLLDPLIDEEIISEIRSISPITIQFLPISEVSNNLYYSRIRNGSYIRKLANNVKATVVFIDYNMILDSFGTNGMNVISFVHTYPTRKIPKFMSKLVHNYKSNQIVTVSQYAARQISELWNIKIDHIKVLYNHSAFEEQEIATNQKQTQKTIEIVTIAHVDQHKNPALWIDVAKQVTKLYSNVIFSWYGDGELMDDASKQVEDFQQINFHGYSNDVKNILNNEANIYLQVSSKESLGISILDAMYHSLPIVITDVGGMPELVTDSHNGFICSNEQELVSALTNLIESSELRREMGFQSNQIYDKKFSRSVWEKEINMIMSEEKRPYESI